MRIIFARNWNVLSVDRHVCIGSLTFTPGIVVTPAAITFLCRSLSAFMGENLHDPLRRLLPPHRCPLARSVGGMGRVDGVGWFGVAVGQVDMQKSKPEYLLTPGGGRLKISGPSQNRIADYYVKHFGYMRCTHEAYLAAAKKQQRIEP